MSLYQDHDQSDNDFMSGGKNLESGEESYSMTGLEVGTICGTIIAFFLVMFFVFYCRRIDSRRKKAGGGAMGTGSSSDPSSMAPGTGRCHDSGSAGTSVSDGGFNCAASTKSGSCEPLGERGTGLPEGIECTEMKTIHPQTHIVPPPSMRVCRDEVAVTVPEASYKTVSERGMRGSDVMESCHHENGVVVNGWSSGGGRGKKRLSGIMSMVGSWRPSKRRYCRWTVEMKAVEAEQHSLTDSLYFYSSS